MRVKKDTCQDLGRALGLEWLETNGRGGFASGTAAGANTRRSHALLLVVRAPVDRIAPVNHLEEWEKLAARSCRCRPISTPTRFIRTAIDDVRAFRPNRDIRHTGHPDAAGDRLPAADKMSSWCSGE